MNESRMSLEDWFLAALDDPSGLYLRGGWVREERLNPDDSVTLQPGDEVVFDVDDGIDERRIHARWDGESITLDTLYDQFMLRELKEAI